MTELIDIVLNLDKHLVEWIAYFGPWFYLIMFLVIFCETGLVVTPFLPGDSLLFALGALAGISGELDVWTLLWSLVLAGILGDGVNYHLGKYFGIKVFERNSRFFKKEHLELTNSFYEKYGGFTIVVARFAPIVRTFAPFIAGIGAMNYRRFVLYNIAGAVTWVCTFILAGYFFGNLPAVKQNFHILIVGIIFVSLLPMIVPYIKHKLELRRKKS